MSNSPLVTYTKISPNRTSPRNNAIDTISIHCVVGQCTAESLGNHFANPSLGASSNYGVDRDGRIGMYVEEKDRSYCTSNAANDHRAITIEVASDTTHPYAVTDAAYEALIKLVADICKRNNIKKLVWSTNKSDRVNHRNGCNMTVHRDYADKSCPGQYLYDRHGDIARRVNKLLGVVDNDVPSVANPVGPKWNIGDEVKLVPGATYFNGRSIPSWLFNMKLYVRGYEGDGVIISTLKTGDITGFVSEKNLVNYNNAEVNTTKPTTTTLEVGDEIKLVPGAKYTTGKAIPQWVINSKLYVRDVQGDSIVFSTLKTGAITGVVDKKYIVQKQEEVLAVGDKVKLVSGAKYTTGNAIPQWVINSELYVRDIQGDNVVFSTLKTGAITGVTNKKNLKKI